MEDIFVIDKVSDDIPECVNDPIKESNKTVTTFVGCVNTTNLVSCEICGNLYYMRTESALNDAEKFVYCPNCGRKII